MGVRYVYYGGRSFQTSWLEDDQETKKTREKTLREYGSIPPDERRLTEAIVQGFREYDYIYGTKGSIGYCNFCGSKLGVGDHWDMNEEDCFCFRCESTAIMQLPG